MAQGNVTQLNGSTRARVDEVKVAYAHIRRLMDRLIIVRNGTDYAAVAEYLGITDGTPEELAILEQRAFDNLDAALAGMTTANNALSNMDLNA